MVVTKKRSSDEKDGSSQKRVKLNDGGGAKKSVDGAPKKSFAKPGARDGGNKKKFSDKKTPFKGKPSTDGKPGAKPADGKPAGTSEKTDWNKFKQDKKDLKIKRKQGNDLFEMTVQAKKVYEKLKCKGTQDKEVLAKELHGLLRGENNYQKLVLAHDTARVVQCLLKYAPAEIKQEISESLISVVVAMSTSKYAHFCVARMIKYGSANIKQKVIEATYGSVVKMVKHIHASTIIDNIYISWASSQQKANLRQELYGDLYKKSKDSSVKCIADTYKDSEHMKLAIINSVKANLNHIANKKLVDNSLVHSVLLDFLSVCSDEEKGEMTVAFTPYIPSLASTKDGVRVSMIFFLNSIVKDRRAIVKSLKEHLVKLCTHEHGHILLLAIINSMDDTKGLKKAVFDQIFSQIEFIVSNEWGRKIIQWFVAPEDTSLFHPQIIAFLEEGLVHSKKDKATRRSELCEAVEEPLAQAIAKNPHFWLRGGHTGLATAAILKMCKGDNSKLAFDKLAEVICDPNWKVSAKEVEEKTDEEKAEKATGKKINKKNKAKIEEDKATLEKETENVYGVEHAGLHIVLKKILKVDAEKKLTEQPTFGASIAAHLTAEAVTQWILLNRASFLLLVAFENGTPETCSAIKLLLSKHVALLKKQTHAGSKLLIKKLSL